MKSTALTPEAYVDALPSDRKIIVERLRKVILKNLPKGFEETMGYGMIGYVVPHKLFSAGYHCDPAQPLPFMNLANQKGSVNVYHMGIYADPGLFKWFQTEFIKQFKNKPDMGKSCIRFKNPERIPYDLIGQLAAKMTPEDWIQKYLDSFKKKNKN